LLSFLPSLHPSCLLLFEPVSLSVQSPFRVLTSPGNKTNGF
jgi:hypothetical protein